jgi:hypothetical protein
MAVAAAVLACSEPGRLPPTTLIPPVIEMAGIVADARSIDATSEYTLDDGRSFTVTRGPDRILGRPGGGLVVLGHDRDGRFLAGFPTQGGLPDDCYVDNSEGVDRGAFVELYGVLWRKSPAFVAAQLVRPDHEYPGGTRFCFNADGLVSGTVAP